MKNLKRVSYRIEMKRDIKNACNSEDSPLNFIVTYTDPIDIWTLAMTSR